MAVTSILAIDMGGYQLAESVAIDPLIGQWAGIVYGSMMGATIVFTIPVGLAAIGKQDVAAFSKGVLYGIAAIPIGTFVGGLVMGIPVGTVALNLIPPVIFSVIIIVCLALWPGKTTAVFRVFSVIINIIAMLGLGLAMVKDLILVPIAGNGAFDLDSVPFFGSLGSTAEGIGVAGSVGLVLAGALHAVYQLLAQRDVVRRTDGILFVKISHSLHPFGCIRIKKHMRSAPGLEKIEPQSVKSARFLKALSHIFDRNTLVEIVSVMPESVAELNVSEGHKTAFFHVCLRIYLTFHRYYSILAVKKQ